MTNTFSWKGFTFMFDLQWVYGNKLINFTRQLMGNRVTFSNAYADIPVNAWTPENQNTMVPSLRLPGDGYENDVDSWSCEPGSFLRLRNIGFANMTLVPVCFLPLTSRVYPWDSMWRMRS